MKTENNNKIYFSLYIELNMEMIANNNFQM